MNSSNIDAHSILTAFDYSSLEDIDPSLGNCVSLFLLRKWSQTYFRPISPLRAQNSGWRIINTSRSRDDWNHPSKDTGSWRWRRLDCSEWAWSSKWRERWWLSSSSHSPIRAHEWLRSFLPLPTHSERRDIQSDAWRVETHDWFRRVSKRAYQDVKWMHKRATSFSCYFPDGVGRPSSPRFHPEYRVQIRGAALMSVCHESSGGDQETNRISIWHDEV